MIGRRHVRSEHEAGLARPAELGLEGGLEGFGVVARDDSVVAAGGAVGARGGGLSGGSG